jgi:SSS family solute:Na+ symporter
VLTQDVIAPLTGNTLSSKTRIFLARMIMCVIAFFLLVWGLWYPLGEALWDYMAITGAIYFVGAFAILTVGIYWKGASRAGAYGAFCCGFLTLISLSPIQKPLQQMLHTTIPGSDFSAYVGLGSAALAVVVMFVLSSLFPDKKKEG